MSVCLPPKLVITSGMILHDKFYSFYMAAVVSIVSRCDFRIKAYHRNQPNKSKLELCKLWIYFNSHLNNLNLSNKMEHFSCKGVCGLCGHARIDKFTRRASWVYR